METNPPTPTRSLIIPSVPAEAREQKLDMLCKLEIAQVCKCSHLGVPRV